MNESYLDEYGKNVLSRLRKGGIFPSPYNFVTYNRPAIDNCIIHDCTLREGSQTPCVMFSIEDKKRIAEKLCELKIPQIEAGFPVISEKEKKGIRALVKMDLDAEIICFARAKREDIDAVVETGADGIVVSFSISGYHRKYKFHGVDKDEYLKKLSEYIEYAKKYGIFVVYGAEDSTRERDLEFLKKAFKTAEEAGADRARIADTLGCIRPSGMAYLVSEIKKVLEIPVEVHCHDDLGLALANSLTAIEAGASTISTSVHGLGERSGITPTEEAIPALKILYGVNKFNISQLAELSKIVKDITGITIAPNKPIAGENAFTHGSGIHQQGVFMNPVTYEVYPPELVGRRRRVCIDELCGSHGILYIAEKELGIKISKETAQKVLSKVKRSYSEEGRKRSYSPDDLRKLIDEAQGSEGGGTNVKKDSS